jgi:ADP-ribose pyrophosphatase
MTDRTYTHPDVFTTGVAQGWADPETDPARIDWPARQAAAAIPFKVVDGRPVNPCASTGVRYGRNELGRWGENLMADAVITVTHQCQRYLLMVERADARGWAVPGGSVEPGETGVQAAVRELAEETGLAVLPLVDQDSAPLYVPDPRASDEAWAVTIPLVVDLGLRDAALPFVRGADDAMRARWIRADSYDHLVTSLRQFDGGEVFPAHVGMLRQVYGGEVFPAHIGMLRQRLA